MESVWSATCNFKKREPLPGDCTADVVVIGAGMAGILTAYMLQKRGADVIVIDGAETASGMTKNTTAKITSQHGLIYDRLITQMGIDLAQQYALANQSAVLQYRELIEQNHIDCHFEELPAYVYSLDETDKLQNEVTAAKRLGIDAEFVQNTTLPFAARVRGAVKFPKQAQFHPLKLIRFLADELRIYEHTMATKVEENVVFTEQGKITAKNIVIATHFPFINAPGYYFARMHQDRSYVIALENAAKLDGMYVDADDQGFSFRNYENLLFLGGGAHRTGKNKSGGSYAQLREAAKEFYPDSTEKYYWSAQDCMPMDGVPYIGHYSSETPNLFVATGFQKWGMTSSMVSAQILSDLISGQNNKNAEVFSPQRFHLSASVETLLQDSGQAITGLLKGAFKIPSKDLEGIEPGHSGVVEYKGERVGVYRDEEGETFIVANKCAHLGCELTWNADELTWDCPCHGSRFDYKGNLINNPAMHGINNK
jgi:glycine/D-amino acid oxidase-like deaminating enzyme/nitrite reductase/ring-hydroxylating ferredoxin subunit